MKLTRDRLKQIIKEELEEMMQVDEVDGVNPEYDESTFENTLFTVSRILRGEGSHGVPQSIFKHLHRITQKTQLDPGEIQGSLLKPDADFYFKMQSKPYHPWVSELSDKQNIANLIRKIGSRFEPQNEQYEKAAAYLEHLNDKVNQMIRMRKQGKEVALKYFGSQAGKQPASTGAPVQERKKR